VFDFSRSEIYILFRTEGASNEVCMYGKMGCRFLRLFPDWVRTNAEATVAPRQNPWPAVGDVLQTVGDCLARSIHRGGFSQPEQIGFCRSDILFES